MNALDTIGVSLKMLIEAGILHEGQEIYPLNGKSVVGILQASGKVEITLNGQKKSYLSLSGAARGVEDLSINGWNYWYTKEDGKNKVLSESRAEFLQKKSS